MIQCQLLEVSGGFFRDAQRRGHKLGSVRRPQLRVNISYRQSLPVSSFNDFLADKHSVDDQGNSDEGIRPAALLSSAWALIVNLQSAIGNHP